MKRMWRHLLFLTAALVLCMAAGNSAEGKVKVKKVTVKSNYGKIVHVAVGKKVKLTTTVKVTPNKAKNKKVTYKSSKKKVATVTAGGYVKGKKTGSCKITVTSKKNKKKKAKISVKVVKQVKSVELDTEEATVYVGATKNLKVTVLPASGSVKKVKWSTSNANVAKVSSAGKITGVAAGTATIKATSIEGSKKSASCTVKVLAANTINIESVQVLGPNAVRVTLDKARALMASQIVVEGKQYELGTYNRRYTIIQLRNYDNKTYDLTLDDNYSIAPDSFVRVSIVTLPGNGTKSLESQAVFVKTSTPPAEKWIGVVGEEMEAVVDLSEYCYGNVSYTVAGSIGGVNYKPRENTLVFTGQYTTVTVETVLTVTAEDELGNTVEKKIHVHVGNSTTVVSYAEDMTVLVGRSLDRASFAHAAGGSGKYTYAALHMPSGLTMNEDGTISGTPAGIGEYEVSVTVTDKQNTARTATAKAVIKVAEQKRVTGKVVDDSGKAVTGASVTCVHVDDGSTFQTTTDDTGAYSVYVAEGSYDITAEFANASDKVYNIAVSSGGRQIDFVLRHYQITPASPAAKTSRVPLLTG
ncbi:MAG: Ig-like domain-containing protein [Lachnospiraceae bacterium]|nr:Ig-like domain-containing protein [Lachnospiraceae bacterium]